MKTQEKHQLILLTYKQQQSRLKEIKDKLTSSSQSLTLKIENQLSKLNNTSQIIIKNAAYRTKNYVQSLQQGTESQNIINITLLSSYLKKQKSHLSKLISSQQSIESVNQKPKSNQELLHTLSKRKKVQKYFQHLEYFGLQKQIQFLEKNILLGNPTQKKLSVIYDNVQTVSAKQEQEIKQKMKILIEELQRVVGLSNECAGYTNSQKMDKNINELNSQSKRLQKIQELVDKQTAQIIMVKDFFNSYDSTSTVQLIQQKISQICNEVSQKQQIKSDKTTNKLENEQIDFLVNFQLNPSQNIKVYKKPYDEVSNLLTSCKIKMKKLKI